MIVDRATVDALTPAKIAELDEVDQAELDRWMAAGSPVGPAPAEPWPPGHRFTGTELDGMTAEQIAAHIDDVEASLREPPPAA